MSKSPLLQNSLMLAPLIGATGSVMSALGLWLMFMVVIGVFNGVMSALRSRLHAAMHLLASVVLAATLTSSVQLCAQVWSLQWYQQVGIYSALIALQCVVLECSGFFQTPWRNRVHLCVLFGTLLVGLGLLRELLGNGTLGSHLSWLAGGIQTDWQGWKLTADGGLRVLSLAPGGFILLGLLVAAWQTWHRQRSEQ
ncbi:NADH:quinone oxidoreductase [Pseudomonas putida]|uniref:NADH:quinone oxidoreductase n=1 Tax=Pseudomonas putida TaxID=303 RepID=A0A2Z4RJ91_PSEPU|nr:Rnf-Nqr domain containing protein [Pseudomonas putida]AWY41006.1 NADH:quinone oxidoreductase [Pseudomonas putida]